jgi:hypothetical protein
MSADISAEVRLARTKADRDAVFAVRRQVFVDEQSVPEELEFDELDMTADHFLALLDGVPAGAGRLVIIYSASAADPGQEARATQPPTLSAAMWVREHSGNAWRVMSQVSAGPHASRPQLTLRAETHYELDDR